MPRPYYMCTGERPSDATFSLSPLSKMSTIFPLLTILAVSVRFRLHKRRTVQASAAAAVGEVDKQKLANIILVLGLLVFIGAASIITSSLDKLELHELNQPPYSYLCYYRGLVNFPLGIFWLFLILVSNKDYIQTILDEVSQLKRLD